MELHGVWFLTLGWCSSTLFILISFKTRPLIPLKPQDGRLIPMDCHSSTGSKSVGSLFFLQACILPRSFCSLLPLPFPSYHRSHAFFKKPSIDHPPQVQACCPPAMICTLILPIVEMCQLLCPAHFSLSYLLPIINSYTHPSISTTSCTQC